MRSPTPILDRMPEHFDPLRVLTAAAFLFVGGFGLFFTRQWIAQWPGSEKYGPRTYTFWFWFARAIALVFFLSGLAQVVAVFR